MAVSNERHWVSRSISRHGSIDHTICRFSSKRRPQREAKVALALNSLGPGRRGDLARLVMRRERGGAARSPHEAQGRAYSALSTRDFLLRNTPS